MHQGMPNKYQFENLARELSVKVFEDHWKLYEGYVLRLNETLKQLSNPYNPEISNSASPMDGKIRELESAKSFLYNAVHLHELFFENCILPPHSAPMPMGPQFTAMVQNSYPQVKSNDFWKVIVNPISKAARGWCVVGFNTLDGNMDVCMLDSHEGIVPVGMYPILVIDVYEHAYAAQYGIDRGTYLGHLFRSINWAVVEHRVATIHSAAELMRLSLPEEAEDYIKDHFKNMEDKEFGFPNEDSYSDQGEPQGSGLDHRNELSVSPNPRAFSSVQGVVTKADLDEAFRRIKSLSVISFSKSEDDYFDEAARGKSARFKEQLWAMLHEDRDE